jgi:hypothetical protein
MGKVWDKLGTIGPGGRNRSVFTVFGFRTIGPGVVGWCSSRVAFRRALSVPSFLRVLDEG